MIPRNGVSKDTIFPPDTTLMITVTLDIRLKLHLGIAPTAKVDFFEHEMSLHTSADNIATCGKSDRHMSLATLASGIQSFGATASTFCRSESQNFANLQ